MQIIKEKIKLIDLFQMSEKMLDDLVKAVVDIETEDFAIDSGLHADLEVLLINNGSKQENLWGINLYPKLYQKNFDMYEFIEFDSMINIKPYLGNRSRGVEDINTQKKIVEIVNKKVEK